MQPGRLQTCAFDGLFEHNVKFALQLILCGVGVVKLFFLTTFIELPFDVFDPLVDSLVHCLNDTVIIGKAHSHTLLHNCEARLDL